MKKIIAGWLPLPKKEIQEVSIDNFSSLFNNDWCIGFETFEKRKFMVKEISGTKLIINATCYDNINANTLGTYFFFDNVNELYEWLKVEIK